MSKIRFSAMMIVFLSLLIATQGLSVAQQATPPPVSTPAPYLFIFSGEPGPDVLTFHEISAGATSDEAILASVVGYYEDNKDRLAILWREDNPTRLAGLFSMYLLHISTVYGEVANPLTTLADYRNEPLAHCGTYTWAQFQIASALGLTWRTVEFVAEHAWLEILVDGQWEIFDATTNTWLSRGVHELMAAVPRTYRQFYTPLLDENRPDARAHMLVGYNMQRLRQRMPTMGIVYMPPGELIIRDHY